MAGRGGAYEAGASGGQRGFIVLDSGLLKLACGAVP